MNGPFRRPVKKIFMGLIEEIYQFRKGFPVFSICCIRCCVSG